MRLAVLMLLQSTADTDWLAPLPPPTPPPPAFGREQHPAADSALCLRLIG